ncbi:MAG: hypothetical protein OEM23_00730 [Gemmatimonadota bacterium]|nr:hypothetical protein [Gemmatimonadota bacterium]MDH3426933.1 hypothetical protein [Gemmatimonadota bacterium]
MKLCVRSLALACGILWGGVFLLVALANQVGGSYGAHFLDFGASIYPGYDGPGGYGSVLVVTMYAVIDGAIGGALLAWLYNRFRKDATAA